MIKTVYSAILKRLYAYHHNEDGNILMMIAICMGVLLGITALMVETALLREHREYNQAALYGAALARSGSALKTDSSSVHEKIEKTHWDQNKLTDGYRDAQNIASTLNLSTDSNGSRNYEVKLDSTLTLTPTFSAIWAQQDIQAAIKGDAKATVNPIKVTFVIDMSTNMTQATWEKVKNGIAIFGDGLLNWSSDIKNKTQINIIPYGDNVNFKSHYYFLQHLSHYPIEPDPVAETDTVYSQERIDSTQLAGCKPLKYTTDILVGDLSLWQIQRVYTIEHELSCRLKSSNNYPDNLESPWPSYWPQWGMGRIEKPVLDPSADVFFKAYYRSQVSCSHSFIYGQVVQRDGNRCFILLQPYMSTPTYSGPAQGTTRGHKFETQPGYVAIKRPLWSGCLDYEALPSHITLETLFLNAPQTWLNADMRKSVGWTSTCFPLQPKFRLNDYSELKNYLNTLSPTGDKSSHDIALAWARFSLRDSSMEKYFDTKFLYDADYVSQPAETTNTKKYIIFITASELKTTRSNTSMYETLHEDLCTATKLENIEIFSINLSPNSAVKQLTQNCASDEAIHYHEGNADSLFGIFQAIAGYLKKDWVAAM